MKENKDEHPPEALITFLMIAIIIGGTLFVNFVISLFIPSLYG
jgi:hypothetical protein